MEGQVKIQIVATVSLDLDPFETISELLRVSRDLKRNAVL